MDGNDIFPPLEYPRIFLVQKETEYITGFSVNQAANFFVKNNMFGFSVYPFNFKIMVYEISGSF